MKIPATALALALTSSLAQAQSVNRIVAVVVPLSDTRSVQLMIWPDRIASLRQVSDIAAKAGTSITPTGTFFTTSFQDGDRTVVLSVISDGCENAGDVPNVVSCPGRIAEVDGSKIKVLKEYSNVIINAVAGAEGYGMATNTDKGDYTTASFNPSTHSITLTGFADGKPEDSPIVLPTQ